MNVSFDYPGFLFVLALLPLLWVFPFLAQPGGIGQQEQQGMAYSQQRRWGSIVRWLFAGSYRPLLALVLRMMLLIALVLSLAGMRLVRTVDNVTVVFLIDGSDSVSPTQREWAMQYITEALALQNPDDRASVVVFGKRALVERAPTHLETLRQLTSAPIGNRTNIAEAIQLGLALLPSDSQKRLVLLSDGEENMGRAREAARLAAVRGVPLDVVPLPEESGDDVLVGGLDAPDQAHEGQSLTLIARIHSTIATRGQLQVFADGELVATQEVDIPAGPTALPLNVEGEEAGFHRYEVHLEAQGDTQAINNRAAAFTMVQGPPRILVIASDADQAAPLRNVLTAAGAQVEVVPPDRAPAEQTRLKSYTAVVLLNVLAHDVPRAVKEALPIYVREQGGSLAMVGGHESFGAGGWRRSAISDVLPVKLEREDTLRRPDVGLVLVIDRSGSMSERAGPAVTKLDLAKEAVYQATLGLEHYDQVGVIVFDTVADWVLPVQKLPHLLNIERALSQFTADGGTDIRSGIEPATQALQTIDAKVRHVILLTDGIASSNYTDLIDEMNANGVTITIVSIGSGANPQLEQIAQRGGGRYYEVTALEEIPRIFLSETIIAAGRDIEEGAFLPVVALPAPIVRGLERIPSLYGYNVTRPRPAARTILTTPDGTPILAQWQYGLGSSLAWTSDLKHQWARDWVSWDEFPTFGRKLLDMMLPPEQTEGLELEAKTEGSQAIFELTTRPSDDATDPLRGEPGPPQIEARLLDPNEESIPLQFEQVGPGHYRAVVDVDTPGSYLAQVAVVGSNGKAGSVSSGLVVAYSPEYRERTINPTLLHNLATTTGGASTPPASDLFTSPGQTVGTVRDVSLPLLWLVLLLVPLDIAARRLLVRRRDLAALRDYVRSRLRRRSRTDTATPGERDEHMARLFAAKERARKKQQE
jgi:Mg-chelatase subunit ChlD